MGRALDGRAKPIAGAERTFDRGEGGKEEVKSKWYTFIEMPAHSSRSGFSLIELLIVVSIIGIIASIAIPRFAESKAAAGDAAAKSDIRNVMTTMEQYSVRFGTYPSAVADLTQVGYNPTADVTFSKFKLETKNGAQSVHMHVGHADSGNEWHANYPKEGMEIEIR